MKTRFIILGLSVLLMVVKVAGQSVDKMTERLRVAVGKSQEWQNIYILLKDRPEINSDYGVTVDIYASNGKKVMDNCRGTLTGTFLQLDLTNNQPGYIL